MATGIPGAKLFAGLFNPDKTYPIFRGLTVQALPINRFRFLRDDHRRAMPILAPAFHRALIEADICLCGTTGWSHGVRTTGRKIAYWYSPAKWLYRPDRYAAAGSVVGGTVLKLMRPSLLKWDRRAVRTVDRHICISTFVASELFRIYGVRAEVLPPPHTMSASAPLTPVPGIDPGFLLSINRLLPYKNVEPVVRAVQQVDGARLVLVGKGPLEPKLQAIGGDAVTMLKDLDESSLRWLYANSIGLVTASFEDFGLTPVEAGSFGKPSAVLRQGGFLDTVVENQTGVFFDNPTDVAIAEGIRRLRARTWDATLIRDQAQRFGEGPFLGRLQEIIEEECAVGRASCNAEAWRRR